MYVEVSSSTLSRSICKQESETDVEDVPLNLTPYIERGEIKKARQLSAVEPTLFAGVQSHAAYIQVNKTNKWNTFFWFFPVETLPLESTPWIIWLQGGPGASSLYGLFNEIGPLQIVNGEAARMPITWASNYSLLFIDNPIGTGFSYSETDAFMSNQDEVGATLLSFIQQFLQVFPELRNAPLFIAGESYAGKYIPAFGHYIHHSKNDTHPINLKGLAIGDGWTDPPSLLHYSDLLLQLGLIEPTKADSMKQLENSARKYWEEGKIDKYNIFAAASMDNAWNLPLNKYNFLESYKSNTEISKVTQTFLNQKRVQKALHVRNEPNYQVFNSDVNKNFGLDILMSVKPWLEEVLEYYGVLCYNGQLDLTVGYALSVHTYHSLKWSGSKAYLDAPRNAIYNPNDSELSPIGFVKASGNFMDVMIRNGGHMLPKDQPAASKYLIDMFINKFKN